MKSTSMRVWAGLFVLVVFVAGLAAGVTVTPWVRPWMGTWMGPATTSDAPPFGGRGPRGGPPPARMTERLLDRVAADIDLTADQDRQLREVFETRGRRSREINDEVRRQFETEQQQMNAEVAAILTPEQMEIFENEIVRRRRDRGGPRGPGGPRRRPRGGPSPPE